MLKRLLSLSLLLLLLSHSLFAEWVYSDEQVAKMIEENEETDRLLNLNKITLESNNLIISNYKNNNLIISNNNKAIMQSYEKIIIVHLGQIEELEKSLKQEKEDSFFSNIKKFFGGFIWGALAGLFGGLYFGISVI